MKRERRDKFPNGKPEDKRETEIHRHRRILLKCKDIDGRILLKCKDIYRILAVPGHALLWPFPVTD
jgi:hypothetical protein